MITAIIFSDLGQFLSALENVAFLIAGALTMVIALVEGISVVIGFSASDIIDAIIPSFEVDLDADGPELPTSALSGLMDWLKLGKAPFLMLLVIFLSSFAATCYTLQYGLMTTVGFGLHPALAPVARIRIVR